MHASPSSGLPSGRDPAWSSEAVGPHRAYESRAVRARIAEFLGTGEADAPTATYLAIGTNEESRCKERRGVEELPQWLNEDVELNRSLWDRESLILHLDVEYVNFDNPGHVYVHPERAFRLQEPVVEAVQALFRSFGIEALHVLTGRGHHFTWRVKQSSMAFARLSQMAPISSRLRGLYASQSSPSGEHVSPLLGEAFAGAGLLIEHVAQQVKLRAAPACEIPVELGAIEVGGGKNGREMISIDITEYADPLCSRVTRIPFTLYLKPLQQHLQLADAAGLNILPIFAIPLGTLNTAEGLMIRHCPDAVAAHAVRTSAKIPDASRATGRLFRAYQNSNLARFHRDFYSEPLRPAGESCGELSPNRLPPCCRHILDQPNDLLLRPACAGRVVRVLLSLGWHPQAIARFIQSKYEGDHDWGDYWRDFDPATRADFYARVFSGIFITRVDDLVDLNCQSAREEGLCFVQPCSDNLERYRRSLLYRRAYERLADRPFNRLFLPEEHL